MLLEYIYGIALGLLAVLIFRLIEFIVTSLPHGDRIWAKLTYPNRRLTAAWVHLIRLYLTPDWAYRLWYRTDMLDAETYRTFQAQGYITDDTDPEYLQKDVTDS